MTSRALVARWCSTLPVFLIAVSGAAGSEGEVSTKSPVSFVGPDFKAVLSLQAAEDPRISPDGSAVLFSVSTADWEANRFDSEIWLARGDEEPFQLTRTKEESSSAARWSPDGREVAFLADRGKGTWRRRGPLNTGPSSPTRKTTTARPPTGTGRRGLDGLAPAPTHGEFQRATYIQLTG